MLIRRLAAASAAILTPIAAAAAVGEPICADRPGLTTGTCTVPAGMMQVETGVAEWGLDRSGTDRTDELAIGTTSLKLGISDRFHVELGISPYSRIRVRDGASRDRTSGFGDLALGAKYRLTAQSAPIQLAVYPFVTIPTAKSSLGPGKVEAGVVVPVDADIPGSGLSLTLSPQIDFVADSGGDGYHVAVTQALGLGASLSSRLSAAVDLWGRWGRDSNGTVRQYAVGPSLAYLVSADVQLDAGVDFGLNRNTSDRTAYWGLAFRF